MNRRMKIASIAAALTLITGGLAIGAPTGGSIFACLSASAGTLTKVSTKAPKCPKGTSLISWSQVGPRGAQGPAGAPGAPGQSGLNGLNGQTGLQGPQGIMGLQGIQGQTGPQGLIGPRGEKGERGDHGDTGPRGEDGLQGIPGPEGPEGAQGPKGDAGYEESLKSFADTTQGEYPVYNSSIRLNNVFWQFPWDQSFGNQPSAVTAIPLNIWASQSGEWDFTSDSFRNALVFTDVDCLGLARGYLMSTERETYEPNAYQGFGKYFVKKRATIQMSQVKSYWLDGGECVNSQPNWQTGSYTFFYYGEGTRTPLPVRYRFTLVDLQQVSYPDIYVYGTYSEWR